MIVFPLRVVTIEEINMMAATAYETFKLGKLGQNTHVGLTDPAVKFDKKNNIYKKLFNYIISPKKPIIDINELNQFALSCYRTLEKLTFPDTNERMFQEPSIDYFPGHVLEQGWLIIPHREYTIKIPEAIIKSIKSTPFSERFELANQEEIYPAEVKFGFLILPSDKLTQNLDNLHWTSYVQETTNNLQQKIIEQQKIKMDALEKRIKQYEEK